MAPPSPRTVGRKRPASSRNDDHHHQTVTDEEVEEFYAIIRRMQAARKKTVVTSGGGGGERRDVAAKRRVAEVIPPWKPDFRPEDFVEEGKKEAAEEEDGKRWIIDLNETPEADAV